MHPKCFVVAAGNLTTDKAIVNRMSTAMQSRMAHFELAVNNDAWLEWATENDIDHRIMSYIRFKPEALYMFNPNHSDYTYPSPRTWKFTSDLIKDNDLSTEDIPLIVSVIGEGTGIEFKGYTDIYRDLPSASDIISKPTTTKLSTEPSMLYAISGFIPTFISEKNIDDVMIYIHRMPKEFQFIALKQVIGKKKSMLKVPVIVDWVKTLSKEYRDVII